MYLTKPQFEAILNACSRDADAVAPGLMDFLIDHRLIEPELFGYRMTEAGKQALNETYIEHEKQKADLKTGPSGKRDFYAKKRDTFRQDDDLTVIKRKPIDPTPIKAKPQTKYKKQG